MPGHESLTPSVGVGTRGLARAPYVSSEGPRGGERRRGQHTLLPGTSWRSDPGPVAAAPCSWPGRGRVTGAGAREETGAAPAVRPDQLYQGDGRGPGIRPHADNRDHWAELTLQPGESRPVVLQRVQRARPRIVKACRLAMDLINNTEGDLNGGERRGVGAGTEWQAGRVSREASSTSTDFHCSAHLLSTHHPPVNNDAL